MSSSPAPEFDTFLRDFITSNARTIFAAVPLPQDLDGGEPLAFTVHADVLGNLIKEGPLPASKSAIDSLPIITVTEEEDCAICLTEYGEAGEVKEMPCKHRYHSDCISKWLGIHGSCPVCRYEMPVDEEEKRRRDGGIGWQVVITVTSRGPVSEQSDLDLVEGNGDSIEEDMEIDLGSNEIENRGDEIEDSLEDID